MKTHNSVLNRKLRQDYGAYAFRNYTALRQRHNAAKGKKFVIIVYADAAGKIIPNASAERFRSACPSAPTRTVMKSVSTIFSERTAMKSLT